MMTINLFLRPARRIGELHVVLGLEDMGPVNIQRLMEANEVRLTL